MGKPTYYLFAYPDTPAEELNMQKKIYEKAGFRVVIFQDGKCSEDIHHCLKNMIRNHMMQGGK